MNGVPRCSTRRLFSTEIPCLSGELLEKKSENSAVVDLVDPTEGKNENLELVRWGSRLELHPTFFEFIFVAVMI